MDSRVFLLPSENLGFIKLDFIPILLQREQSQAPRNLHLNYLRWIHGENRIAKVKWPFLPGVELEGIEIF